MNGLLKRFSSLIALPHSVFALPYAVASFFLAARAGSTVDTPGSPLFKALIVIVAVVSARTAAMAFNRLVDRRIDGENPRTASRELPQGALSVRQVWRLIAGAAALFFLCAALLGNHCLVLSPFVLAALLGYSYTKRFTRLSHFSLGFALALAPGGAWWVLRPQLELTPVLLMGAVLLWVSGFDILYSCQDVDFDRRHGLFSIPAKLGTERALAFALRIHVIALLLFFAVGLSAGLGPRYFVGLAALGLLFLGQHALLSPRDLSRINHAFFTFNGAISLSYLFLISFAISSSA